MATIVIKNLPESSELDRQAMLAITGGSRFRAGAAAVGRPAKQGIRLFELSPGGAGKPPAKRTPSR